MSELLYDVWQGVTEDWWVRIVVGVVVALILVALRPVRDTVVGLAGQLAGMWIAQRRITAALGSVEGSGVWLHRRAQYPSEYRLRMLNRDRKPVLMIANLKGGVGKTTIAANLGAHFSDKGEKVLFVDLDFQGSLSSMLLRPAARIPVAGSRSAASMTLDGVSPQQLLLMAAPVRQLDTAKAITAYHDLAAQENRVLVRWLLGEDRRDVRYLLAEVLLSDQVQGAFDRIIIDAPPRQTLGAIQAICASTHLLIPTVLDGLSGEAVGTYVEEVLKLRDSGVCPHLTLLGVVGSMTASNIGDILERVPDSPPRLQVAEREGLAEIRKALGRIQHDRGLVEAPIPILPEDTFIQKAASIANSAGDSLAYVSAGDSVRRMFQRLGIEVARRMII